MKSNFTLSHTRTLSIACRGSSLAEIVITLMKLFAHADGGLKMLSYISIYTDLTKNNPSVSCADSSLYTREPWFAVNRKCKCHTVNKRRFNIGFHILMKISKILHMGKSHLVDEVY